MATTTYLARLQCRDSKRLLALRRAIAESTAANPVPQPVLVALHSRLAEAIVPLPLSHDSGHPQFFLIELDLAPWLADLIASDWPAAQLQDGEG